MQPTQAQIRALSYAIWEREGRPDGRDRDHWFRAESELAGETATARPKTGSTRRKSASPRKATARTASN